jgi:hypothetical protein
MPTETLLALDALNAKLLPAASVGKNLSVETRYEVAALSISKYNLIRLIEQSSIHLASLSHCLF